MPRGRKKQPTKEEKDRERLDRVRATGIFKESLRGETFGDHPGYCDVMIRVSVRNRLTKREEKLPGKDITLLMSSIDEVDQMLIVIERALKDWAAGLSPYL